MSLIQFKNVSHYYGGKAAVKDLSFEIEDKKITAIIGKSGSGKSTLLQIINGLIKPTGGSVYVFGNPLDYSNIYKTRLKIGYSVQGTGLFPHMSIYNNIAVLGKITNVPKHDIERRIDTLMSFVNLPPSFKTKFPYQLSGGEQQRVGICRAMLLDPPVFLLDEAFAALDPETKSEIHTELLDMQKAEPRTIVIVTHDLNEAVKLADNIMFMQDGEIKQYGSKKDVLNNPASVSVKDYMDNRAL
ncbi:MAG TPA: ATP-binding cassette domain-containing protein [Ignavibacteria bacterium]|nr:ATP-binding cassette domain-containing protein [Ignavibacteria bacterium]HRF66432.1 ATP-binding cassette domain-containing protein [Ignavibacteria bacterium]HRJ05392.1 ATP-binding cassette domain-containing protein [Ignavibacteria bacterium]